MVELAVRLYIPLHSKIVIRKSKIVNRNSSIVWLFVTFAAFSLSIKKTELHT